MDHESRDKFNLSSFRKQHSRTRSGGFRPDDGFDAVRPPGTSSHPHTNEERSKASRLARARSIHLREANWRSEQRAPLGLPHRFGSRTGRTRSPRGREPSRNECQGGSATGERAGSFRTSYGLPSSTDSHAVLVPAKENHHEHCGDHSRRKKPKCSEQSDDDFTSRAAYLP